jgi:DNA mismatch repair protein MutS2
MNDQMLIEINQGRHPLIPDGKVVPISLSLGFSEGAADTVKFSPFERSASHYENSTVSAANTHQPVTPAKQGASNAAKNQNERSEQKTKTDTTPTTTRPTALVITGPNTGGKTVTLKTVGLFILMAHAGLHLPAQSAKSPYTEKVYADIGDEQSIEQSLSTFSSHMKNIVEIVGGAGPKTVALLDELGAGTDPAEGAALAVAILETLREKGTLVMATTHYTELKKYAMATDGVSNASMEFDIKTLSPTYRLRMGMPGRSNAFEISRKLGLPEAVIERAETDMSTDYLEFESVIESAEQSAKAADENRILAENLKKEADELKASLEKEYAKLNEKRDKITEKARKEAEKAVADAREYADIVKEELRAIIKDAKDAGIEINSGHLYQRLNENRKLIEQIEPIVTPALARHCEERSDEAIQSKIQNPGTGLLRYARNDGVGARNKTTPEPVRKNASGWTTIRHTGMSANASNTPKIKREKLSTVPLTLTVIGQNLDDAQIEVEKYIDDAYLAGIEKVTIIHGRGEGILRTGIRKLLLSNPHVKTYQKAPYTQGGEGATIVTLK